ncbi:MAG: transporter substrate-binding domain-containing protein [Rhodoferax sp.]|jgi:polar amino acid transport system substrate-binding protein
MAFLFSHRMPAPIARAACMLLATCLCFCGPAQAQSAAKPTIVLNTSPSGFAPYTYVESNQTPKGIVYDVANHILHSLGYKLSTVEVPRKRVELQLMMGELDATPRAIEWTEHAGDFVFSDPIIKVRAVLVVRSDSKYATLKDLRGRRIGMRLGYEYMVFSKLTQELESGQLIRSDTTSDLSMFKMLQAKRVDAALIDELSAHLLLKQHGIKDLRVLEDPVDEGVELRLMFAPRHRALVKDFNRELANLKHSGDLATIISKYTGQ